MIGRRRGARHLADGPMTTRGPYLVSFGIPEREGQLHPTNHPSSSSSSYPHPSRSSSSLAGGEQTTLHGDQNIVFFVLARSLPLGISSCPVEIIVLPKTRIRVAHHQLTAADGADF